jgi:hypothetical protein
MNLKRILAIGGLATIVAVSNVGCDTPGGNYAIGSSYEYLANQNAAQGNLKAAYGAGAGLFKSVGNAEAARKAAEAGRSQVIIINGQEYVPKDAPGTVTHPFPRVVPR